MAGPTGATIRVVYNRLPTITAAMDAAIKTAVAKAGHDVQAAAQARCPVRTGTLRRSITTQIAANGYSATIGPSVDYGIYVEYGTAHMGARPYMRPAAELVAPKLAHDISSALQGATR